MRNDKHTSWFATGSQPRQIWCNLWNQNSVATRQRLGLSCSNSHPCHLWTLSAPLRCKLCHGLMISEPPKNRGIRESWCTCIVENASTQMRWISPKSSSWVLHPNTLSCRLFSNVCHAEAQVALNHDAFAEISAWPTTKSFCELKPPITPFFGGEKILEFETWRTTHQTKTPYDFWTNPESILFERQ